jgi:cupin superfamily acireductone dioxygenase involved in methionine salvage
MVSLLQNEGMDARSLPWIQLEHQVDVYNVHEDTIKRALKARGYKKCVACNKTWHPPQNAEERKQFCRTHN